MSLFPLIFIRPCFSFYEPYGLLIPISATFLLAWFSRWFSHKMEKRADHAAVETQLNEGVYARALENISRENLLPAVNINKRQTHPDLYDRMIAAGITPEYPRPKRPKSITWLGFTISIILGALCGAVLAHRYGR
jgi:Zn-dependent protease with chaperone function